MGLVAALRKLSMPRVQPVPRPSDGATTWCIPLTTGLDARMKRYLCSEEFSAATPGLSRHWQKRLRQLDVALEADGLRVVNTSVISPPFEEASAAEDLLLGALSNRMTDSGPSSPLWEELAPFRTLMAVERAEMEALVRKWPIRMLHALRGAGVIVGCAGEDSSRRLLSIGSGHCLTVLILGRYFGWRTTVVDLSQQIAIGAAILSAHWPEAVLRLPDERAEPSFGDVDFLTPQQVGEVPLASFDVAENSFSFGEMDIETVVGYFELIRRSCRESGLLYSLNRESKVCDFADYPFLPGDALIVDVTHPSEPDWLAGELFAGGPTREVLVRLG